MQEVISFKLPFLTLDTVVPYYLAVLRSRLPSRRPVPMFRVCRRSDTLCRSAAAGRCSGRAGSGRDAPLTGTPPSLVSDGVFSTLRTEPLSPVHTEDGAGRQVPSPQIVTYFRVTQHSDSASSHQLMQCETLQPFGKVPCKDTVQILNFVQIYPHRTTFSGF